MTPTLSPNTQAILLLTAPLIAGRGTSSSELLSPGEYKRLARHLREIQRQPADLVSPDAADLLRACQPVIDEARLQRLLGRGFLLSQVIERWQARAIWVVSRADAEYPRRIKARLREDAPAVIYGCGDLSLVDKGGVAVVGSRDADEALIEYTLGVGRLAARSGRTVISGGAKGIDLAAMRGALEAGGNACGVLADSLQKTAMNREHRNLLMVGQLVLISPFDPSAGFNVGHAMQRNKLIYALADISLVVCSDLNKGGTWTGAVEQLDKFNFGPIFVRTIGDRSSALEALRQRGAFPWPEPVNVDSFEAVFKVALPTLAVSPQVELLLPSGEVGSSSVGRPTSAPPGDIPPALPFLREPEATDATIGEPLFDSAVPGKQLGISNPQISLCESASEPVADMTPAKEIFAAVSRAIQNLFCTPMKETEVAAVLDVSKVQAKIWLQRLVEEGVLERRNKPVAYLVKQMQLFE